MPPQIPRKGRFFIMRRTMRLLLAETVPIERLPEVSKNS